VIYQQKEVKGMMDISIEKEARDVSLLIHKESYTALDTFQLIHTIPCVLGVLLNIIDPHLLERRTINR
jgi:hypothetical protein